MRAVRLDGPGCGVRLDDLPVPRPAVGEVVLRVLAAGVCHTELQLQAGTFNPGVWPITLGHEIVGEVVDGPAELRGQRALVYYATPCGECDWCQTGQEQVCPNAGPQPGLSTDGGFAEFVRVPSRCLVPLPGCLDAAAAAPLGCAAATAYHALNGVAKMTAGESMVVYGVGGVGLPLIQLGRQRGARVLAVSRSRRKLELARELGAEPIDASADDPALAVRRRTAGQGAHVVFELVGRQTTMTSALTMLRRQGRLVFVGYSIDRLRLNPLELVLRELQLLSSLGNTRDELRAVVELAAAGQLRVPIAGRFALEEAGQVLDALGAGQLEGRAVLLPSQVPGRAHTLAAQPRVAVGAAAPPPRAGRPPEDAVLPLHSVPSQPVTSGTGRPLEAELLTFVGRGSDAPRNEAEFTDLALRLFAYQFAHNRPYRLFCERRGASPATLGSWRDIPAVPIGAFKEALLAAEPIAGATEFNSSGTTRPEHKSRHVHPSLTLYDLNARTNFAAHVLPDRERMRLLVVFPPRHELPHSSLAHWLSLQVESFGTDGSGWFVSNTSGLEAPALVAALRQAETSGEPVGVLAASFGLVHVLEHCLEADLRFALPPGSRVMDTGGYKGRSREYAKAELYGLVTERLGVPPSHIVNMYGMTEHGTQFLDAVLRRSLEAPDAPFERFKAVPPWARTRVVDPETLAERPSGERGLLLHVDLINRASVVAVLSEDVGQVVGDGFEVLGRAHGAEARGCSIALDELIEAVGGERWA